MGKQINLNSLLLVIVGVLLTFILNKLDHNNTEIIKVSDGQSNLSRRVDSLEKRVDSMQTMVYRMNQQKP